LKIGWKSKCALFFLAVATLNYWPAFLGRTPLPTESLSYSVPFQDRDWPVPQTRHAEMGDTITQFYPWRVIAGSLLRHGIIPLWNPKQLAGSPMIANDQSAILYPPNWTFIFLSGPAAWAFTFILKIALAGFFTALFVTSIGGSVAAAVISGIVFAFCGFITAWQGFPNADSALWIPLGCYGIQLLRREQSGQYIALTAFALSMMILGGHPGVAAHAVLLTSLYAAGEFIASSGQRFRFSIAYVIAAILGVGIAAIQALPTIEWLSLIHRTLNVLWGPLPTEQWIALFSRDMSSSPNSIGVYVPVGAIYVGAMTLVLAPIAILHKSRKQFVFFATVVLISAATAYGVEPLSLLSLQLPVLKGVKKDEMLVFVEFGFAVLAGLGFCVLERWESKVRFDWRRLVVVTSIGVVFLITFTAGLGIRGLTVTKPAWLDSLRGFGFFFTLALVIVLVRLYTTVGPKMWTGIAFTLIVADMFSFAYGYVPFQPASTAFPRSTVFESLRSTGSDFRVIGLDGATGLNWEEMYGLEDAGGYDFKLETLFQLTEDLGTESNVVAFESDKVVRAQHRILDLLNVKYLIASSQGAAGAQLRAHPERFREVREIPGIYRAEIFENLKVLPRVFTVPVRGVEVVSSPAGQLELVRRPSFDPLTNVVLDRPLPPEQSTVSNEQKQASRVLEFREIPNDVRVRIAVAEPSVLVLSQMYYPGWSVLVDGKPAEFLRTNYAFAGTHLDAGTHDVQFVFKPWTFRLGAVLTLISIAIACRFLVLRNRTWVGSHFTRVDLLTIFGVVAVALALIIASNLIVKASPNRISEVAAQLVLNKYQVTAGQGDYVMTISSIPNSTAIIQYSLNGGAPEEFIAAFDSSGQSRFNVSATTPKGTYRFLAFRPSGYSKWLSADASITVK
jgi:hypothetical protein